MLLPHRKAPASFTTSHTMTSVSREPEASSKPSPLNRSADTAPLCPEYVLTASPVLAFHSMTVPSL